MVEWLWLLPMLFEVVWIVLLIRSLEVKAERFSEKWPPISDDEFVARCSPGTRRETALRVRRIVSEQLGVPYSNIYPEQHFLNDLNAD